MSLSRLTPHLKSDAFSMISRRFVHRSPDYAYLERGLKNSYYRNIFVQNVSKMNQYPGFMGDYFKTAAVMKCQNKVPFVHAQSAIHRAPSIFLKTALSSASQQNQFFKYLRQPSDQFALGREDLIKKISKYIEKHGKDAWTPGSWNYSYSRLDADPEIRPYLMSVSYSMMDFTEGESASYYFFKNSSGGNIEALKSFANKALETALIGRGLSDKVEQVLKSLEPLYDEYAKLKVGTLYVIGVPKDKLEKFFYDSKSFGVPTGLKIEDVAQDPGESPVAFSNEEGGLQARLMIFKDTLKPSSGIDVIDINTSEEVERYCKGHSLDSTEVVFKPKGLFCSSSTEAERLHRKKQSQLDQKVIDLAFAFRKSLA